VVIITCLAVVGWIVLAEPPPEEEAWGGVDCVVIQKFAAAAGREAREPFINTDRGNLILFVFALTGAVSGFTTGYYWRRLITEKS